MVLKVLRKMVWKFLWESKFTDICILRPDTLPQLIVKVVKFLDIGLKRLVTLPQINVEVMDVGHVLPITIPLIIADDVLI